MLITKSTFVTSDVIETLIKFESKIHGGYIDAMPIEQQIGALASGSILIDSMMSTEESQFTDEEILFVNSLSYVVKEELSNIGIGDG